MHLSSYLPYNRTAKDELLDFGVLPLVSTARFCSGALDAGRTQRISERSATRNTRRRRDCLSLRAASAAEYRYSSQPGLGTGGAGEHERGRAPGTIPRRAANRKKGMAGSVVAAGNHLHGSDDSFRR